MDNMHVWQVQHIAPYVEDKSVECYLSLLQGRVNNNGMSLVVPHPRDYGDK
jgi:hypothetical protein